MSEITTQLDHGQAIGFLNGQPIIASPLMQNFIDDLTQKLNFSLFGNQVTLESYTVGDLPTVPDATAPGLIFVSDETGGAVVAFSDGTNWRRVTDRTIVS